MSQFAALLWTDLRLLYRTGYVHATVAIFAMLLVLLWQIPSVSFAGFADLVTAVILVDQVLAPVMLVGLMILLERGEGALMALAVAPVPASVRLAARTVSVSLICAAEMIALVLIIYDGPLAPGLLIAGLLAIAATASLLGVVAAARVDTLFRLILPMIGWILFLSIPGYAVLFDWRPDWLALHPTAPPALLLEAAFAPVSAARLAYAAAGTGVWLALAWLPAIRAYRRLALFAAGG